MIEIEFPEEIEELLTEYCNMYYQLHSKSEYKNDIKIKIYFEGPFRYEYGYEFINLISEYSYKDKSQKCRRCVYLSGMFGPKPYIPVNFSDAKFIKLIFRYAIELTMVMERQFIDIFIKNRHII